MNVVDNPATSRYELWVDDHVVGFAAYSRRDPDVLVLPHVEIDTAYEGRGLGSALVQGALDQVRAAGDRVVPVCPFVVAYLKRHPEYTDLVTR